MRKIFNVLAAVTLGALTASSALADQITTTSGDTIKGTIKSVNDGVMKVSTESMNDVSIPLTHIATFSSDGPIIVQLSDGTQVSSTVAAGDAGTIKLVAPDGTTTQSLNVASIERINPQAFTLSVQIGGSLTRGNTFTDTLNAGINATYVVGKEKFSVAGEYLYGRTKNRDTNVTPVTTTTNTTTDRWDVDAKYQHFFTKKFYGYADVDVTKDRISSIAIRAVPSIGAGYQLFNKSPFKLGFEGGAAYVYQEYTNGTHAQSDVAVKLAYHLTYDFTPDVQLFNDVTYYPTLAHIENAPFLINTDLGLHMKLYQKLFAEVKIEWDYNSSPANNALKNDERYIASLGYSL